MYDLDNKNMKLALRCLRRAFSCEASFSVAQTTPRRSAKGGAKTWALRLNQWGEASGMANEVRFVIMVSAHVEALG